MVSLNPILTFKQLSIYSSQTSSQNSELTALNDFSNGNNKTASFKHKVLKLAVYKVFPSIILDYPPNNSIRLTQC